MIRLNGTFAVTDTQRKTSYRGTTLERPTDGVGVKHRDTREHNYIKFDVLLNIF